LFIARFQNGPAPARDGPRVNEQIGAFNVRLIDHRGEQVGIVPRTQALQMASDLGLDLVEISPSADPPVCKILDYGKFKYEAQKKAAEARKRQKTIDVKEIKMRPAINDHDYDVKMRAVRRFLEEGDKVKVTLRFRGRELAHQELGHKVLDRVRQDVADSTKVEQEPRMEGRQLVMVIAPK
jgi:translation initiation factor IF-3